jgi:hypothetical protein
MLCQPWFERLRVPSGDDGGVEAPLGRDTAGDREGDGERERSDADDDAGAKIAESWRRSYVRSVVTSFGTSTKESAKKSDAALARTIDNDQRWVVNAW